MTKPMRRALLNAEISLEARRIAHMVTRTCKGENLPDDEPFHTPNCNCLKNEIENLALKVKYASSQRSGGPEPPPAFELNPETDA